MNHQSVDYHALVRLAHAERSAYLAQLLRNAARKLRHLFQAAPEGSVAGDRVGTVQDLKAVAGKGSNQNRASKAA